MPFASVSQERFSAGMWRSVAPRLIPADGAFDLVNGLLDEDGSVYRRGGASRKTISAYGTSLRTVWDAILAGGPTTIVGGLGGWGILNPADNAVVSLPTVIPPDPGQMLHNANPARIVSVAGLAFIPPDTSTGLLPAPGIAYGGSRKTAGYSTGTVTLTNGSTAVTGVGTSWIADADAGMILQGPGTTELFAVQSINGNTSLTLTRPWPNATTAGAAYSLSPTVQALPTITRILAVAARRLFACSGSRAYFTPPDRPTIFYDTDQHEVPGGAQIIGAHGIDDRMLLFTTQGVFVVGNLNYNLLDRFGNVQQTLRQLSDATVLWSHEGLAGYGRSVIAPCVDGIYLVDGVSESVRISDSITPLIQRYVEEGHKTGVAAIYRGHYFLPILNSVNAQIVTIVGRLERPGGGPPAWSTINGDGATSAAYTRRVGTTTRRPALLGASLASTARVLDCSGFFTPTVTNKADSDGTSHVLEVETRDFSTGANQNVANTVRRVRARYELEADTGDAPTVEVSWATGPVDSTWHVVGTAGPSDGSDSQQWVPSVAVKEQAVRLKVKSIGPSKRLVLRGVELLLRSDGRQ